MIFYFIVQLYCTDPSISSFQFTGSNVYLFLVVQLFNLFSCFASHSMIYINIYLWVSTFNSKFIYFCVCFCLCVWNISIKYLWFYSTSINIFYIHLEVFLAFQLKKKQNYNHEETNYDLNGSCFSLFLVRRIFRYLLLRFAGS